MKPHPRRSFAAMLPNGASVLDIGCWNYSYFKLCQELGLKSLRHFGVDVQAPIEPAPPGYEFAAVDVNSKPLPFPDGSLDAVVASHVIEHLTNPLLMMDEIFRVLRVGGLVYLECPSDRSVKLPSMPFKFAEHRSLNFYDDPTHVGRPYSPQSLYRLLSMYQAEVLQCRYLTSGAVRVRFPWLLLRALLFRDAALLEFAVWWSVGFSVYAVGKKVAAAPRKYVLSA